MGFEYVCPAPPECQYRFYRINTDVDHDGKTCPGCGSVLVKREFGYNEPEETVITKKKKDLSEGDRLKQLRENA